MGTQPGARFRDARSALDGTLTIDGRTVELTLDGVTFRGISFDSLEPVDLEPRAELARFTLAAGALCACSLEVTLPVTLMHEGRPQHGRLEARIELGPPKSNGGLAHESVQLSLAVDHLRIEGAPHGWFEDGLSELCARLPAGWELEACFTCALSDYFPAGHGLNGDLACFRDSAAAYAAVTTKTQLFSLWEARTEFVQETHRCPAFQRRAPGTGYRG